MHELLEFTCANGNTQPCTEASSRFVKWSTPHGQSLKVNVDGAWNQKDKVGGVGIVIRTHKASSLLERPKDLTMFFWLHILKFWRQEKEWRL